MQKRKFPFLCAPKERKESINTFWTESKVKTWLQNKDVFENQMKETNVFKIETISLFEATKRLYDQICWAHNKSNCKNCLKKLLVDKLFNIVSQTTDLFNSVDLKMNQIKTKINEISHYLQHDWKSHSHKNDKYSICYFRSKQTRILLTVKKLNDDLKFISTYFGIFTQHCMKLLYEKECNLISESLFTCASQDLQDIRITNLNDFQGVNEQFAIEFVLQNFAFVVKQKKNQTINLALDFAANRQETFYFFIGNIIQNTYKQHMQFEMLDYYIQYEIIVQGKKIVHFCDDKIYFNDGMIAQLVKPLHTFNINTTDIFFGYAFQKIFPIPSNNLFGINQGESDKIQMLNKIFIKDITKIILAYGTQIEFCLTKIEDPKTVSI